MPNQKQTYYVSDFIYTGGMNYDDTILAIQKGQSLTALNITTVSTAGQGDQSMQEINGNTFEFALPTVIAQNKQYSFTITEPSTGTNTYNVTFLNINGSVIGTASLITTGNLVTDTNTFRSTILSVLSAYTPTITENITGGVATLYLTLTGLLGFDFIMEDTPIAVSPPSVYAYTDPVVVNEAIDVTLAGLALPVGGIDYLDDLFLFSTSQLNNPQSFSIENVTGTPASNITIIVSGNQTANFVVGSSVVISGVNGVPNANGTWSVLSSTSSGFTTNIVLYMTNYEGTYSNGGTITLYSNGYLLISVNQYQVDTNDWVSTILLQTKAINSRFTHPFRKEINANKNNNVLSIYWTDGNDFMRVFSYTGAYTNNGAIENDNINGFYTYDGISESTKNIQNELTPIVRVSQVLDSGGAVPSGDWSYAVIPLDASLTAAQISILTQPVNIYNGNFAQPSQIVGTVGTNSAMQVVLTITEIPKNVYSYMELIGINYVGDTETAYLIKTVPIPLDATTITITHTGLEDTTPYTDGFVLNSLNYVTAQTQTISSNTLVYANLTAAAINDFTAISQTWTHILGRNTTALKPLGDDRTGYTLGEYQIPTATGGWVNGSSFIPSGAVGHMLNETYRYWVLYELTAGGFTPIFWIDDIRFDLNTVNVANPFGDNRRTGNNITSYDLSPDVNTTPTQNINSYVFYVTFQNSGLGSTLVDGVPFYSLVSRVWFFRTDNTIEGYNEVLSSGLIMRHVIGTATDNTGNNLTGYPNGGGANYIYDNPFACVDSLPATSYLPNTDNAFVYYYNYNYLFNPGLSFPTFQYGAWNSVWGTGGSDSIMSGNTPYSCSFYSPDVIYGQVAISFNSSEDYLFNYGQPDWNAAGSFGNMDATFRQTIPDPTTGTYITGVEIRLSGCTRKTTDAFTYWSTTMQQAVNVPNFAGNVGGVNGLVYCSGSILNIVNGNAPPDGVLFSNYPFSGPAVWDTPAKIWIYTNSSLNQTSAVNNPDIGMYYAQYYRNLNSVTASANADNYPNNTKFGAITTGEGIPTGAFIDITGDTTTASVDVYGGDTFNQKSFLKLRYPTNTNIGAFNLGGGLTCVFFCQNRMNFNMRTSSDLAYPSSVPIDGWINDYNGGDLVEGDLYDRGYTPRNPDNTLNAYNSAYPYVTKMPDRIIYSLMQPQNNVTNNYQLFPPFNFVDLSSDAGQICNIFNIQGELFVIQLRQLLRMFYNDRGTMNVGEASTTTEVSLGSGLPFSKPPEVIADIGNANNLGLIYGRGVSGEDVVAWIDIETRQLVMFSKSGLKRISLEGKMRSFFYNNLNLVNSDLPPN